ncbi:H(+)/Cl(-) exchange transporter ClcA [Caulifigura coniformis]|uniref:H(+)/Cl(-) exchange transporter ClcA n=1 Tax=Caulifigura coniformis TaxID=2527983 RepID=A0A517SBE7_9PLAN|nr:chloride channel protein [Caulifigura coniformis]QDT53445.1 H(+)/Cl(-) exchange transporter ClcA [Caulifigura coniformis]
MKDHSPVISATTEGLTISPGLDAVTDAAAVPAQQSAIDGAVVRICGLAILLGCAAGVVGQLLVALIGLVTHVAFFGRVGFSEIAPAEAVSHMGWWVVVIPVIGGLIVGVMARFGSKAIRGHGIPEAMEQVLTNESRIPARITFLKPLSAAVSIGTGGPFGAEGPIIATGGALGSVMGQILSTTAAERKTLLAAGAAAGMTAVFGTPVSAVLLAIELLLFEFRPRSIIPVALAATAADGIRMMFTGMGPAFPMPNLVQPTGGALIAYLVIGALMGVVSVGVTRIVYGIEDAFEHLPVHWMWWPAIGGLAVGLVGYYVPDTLGVGYYNITRHLSGTVPVGTIAVLVGTKFVSWAIALGSGTSGGTLAPLLTFGSGIGALMGAGIATVAPFLGVDVRVAALVGMATMFAGASRAMLASAVFAFETTLQPVGLLPLLGGCAAAYLTSSLLMRNSIMTEKIARRGIKTPEEYMADALDHVHVRDVASKPVVALKADDPVGSVRTWIEAGGPGTSHQGYPVVNEAGVLVGVLTRRNVLNTAVRADQRLHELISRPPKFVYDDCTVRQAADHMVNHGIGRLPVVARGELGKPIGMLTRSDVLSVFQKRVREAQRQKPTIQFRMPGQRRASVKS